MKNIINKFSHYVHIFPRLVLAITFLVHGYPKILDCSGLISLFDSKGIPSFLAYLIGPFEVIGGLLLLYGIFKDWATRAGSILLAIIMLGAISVVHIKDGWNANDWLLFILAVLVHIFIIGTHVIYTIKQLFRKISK